MIGTRVALLGFACLISVVLRAPALGQDALPDTALPGAQEPGTPETLAQAAPPAPRPAPRVVSSGDTIQSVKVEGAQRIEPGTILSYILLKPGDPFDPDRIDRSLKTLFATGLFQDVNLHQDGRTLVVTVVENPIVNRIAFEGNHKESDDTLRPLIQLRPRAVFTAALAQADRQKILDAYAHRGYFSARVEPKIIRLDQNRVDVVFEISDGAESLVSRIAFVGNRAFDAGTLKDVVSSREEAFWRFLSTSDSYDPERVNYDRELLRRFYLKHGYADIDITGATAELSPDRTAFFLTFTMSEGERYRVGKITVNSQLRKLDGAALLPDVEQASGDWYDGDAVERSVTAINNDVQNRGYAFVDVKPRIDRNRQKHIVDLVFDVSEGPRVFVERIDIVGNTRTQDKVIRREMRLAEGDAYNAEAIRRSRQRLQDLGYFNAVNIASSPGSAADKALVTTTIEEKATGELSVGGGFSTDSGLLVNLGLRERNLVGTGIDANIVGTLAQRQSSADFSLTDPYFLDRNLLGGVDLFYIQNNNRNIAEYSETRAGFSLRLGYDFNEHLRQVVNYSLVDRNVYNIASTASDYILSQSGYSLLSQVGQTLTLDHRDSRVDPHDGYVVRFGTDFAGLGGDVHYVRTKVDGTEFIPLDRFTGNSDWGFAISAGVGYLSTFDKFERVIDNFFLGGDNLRGFLDGGAGPHDSSTGDSLGGHFLWTQSTELRVPLPVSPDLGLSGRIFVDVGALSQVSSVFASNKAPAVVYDNSSPRVGAGVGVSWNTPFGLINIDLADPVVKYKFDKTQVFRFGFGTRF